MLALPGIASPQQGPSEDEIKQANNPLASVTAFNIQNYYVPDVTELPDETLNTFWLRLAQPAGPFLIRASLPMPTLPIGNHESESGVGDLNVFATYITNMKASMIGIGPLFAFPTASEDVLGSEKWQAGAALIYFNFASAQIQYGGLLTWQRSFDGEEDRDDTNAMAAQPFVLWQIGGGTYLRTAPIAVFNLEKGNYHVPFGFGIGKVMKIGGVVYNIFMEPQFSILTEGPGQPDFQLYTALNMQF
jgi:hypothetical protein